MTLVFGSLMSSQPVTIKIIAKFKCCVLRSLVSVHSNSVFEFLFSGASGLDERLLIRRITEITDVNALPVNNSLDAVNVTLDITFHGVIDLVNAFNT